MKKSTFRKVFEDLDKKVLRQELIILDVTEQIWAVLNKRKLKKQELAKRMNMSKSNISQLLSGSRNMTLRSLSDIAYALDMDVKIKLIKRRRKS